MKKTLLILITNLLFVFAIQAQGIVGKWKLSSMQLGENQDISVVAPVTLNVSKDNKIGGRGGCNSYGGSYSITKSNKVEFSGIFSTKMYCEKTSELEDAYFQGLQEAKTARVKNGKLIIQNKEKDIVLVFEKEK